MASEDETRAGSDAAPSGGQPSASVLAVRLVIGLAALLVLWQLRDVALFFFGAIVAAAILRSLAEPVASYTRFSPGAAVVLVALILVTLLVGILWLVGQPMVQQLQELRSTVPRAWSSVVNWLHSRPFGAQILSWGSAASEVKLPWERVAGIASASASAIGDVLLALLVGIYLAVDPQLYREGFLRLLPRRRRADVGAALTASGVALQRWMIGQALTMLVVGATVGIGLAILGIPIAGAMGLVSGLFEFVPFFGAIAWALLATLLAFAQGPERALYVAIFCIALQQIEGNVVIPLVQRWAVHLPPVLSVLAVVLFGTLFGVVGVVLGTPLMVVAMVLVRKLWVDRLDPPRAT